MCITIHGIDNCHMIQHFLSKTAFVTRILQVLHTIRDTFSLYFCNYLTLEGVIGFLFLCTFLNYIFQTKEMTQNGKIEKNTIFYARPDWHYQQITYYSSPQCKSRIIYMEVDINGHFRWGLFLWWSLPIPCVINVPMFNQDFIIKEGREGIQLL